MSPKSALASSPELAEAQHAKELEDACQAVRLASKLCRAVQQQLSDAETADKQDDSPVTVADYGAQAVVAWALSRAAPGEQLSMVAEEDSASLRAPGSAAMLKRITGLVNSVIAEAGGSPLTGEDVLGLIDLGASPGGSEGHHWVLDPIDGTRGFVGRRQYAVCLGMLQGGAAMLGVLGCPNLPRERIQDDDGSAGAARAAGEAGRGRLFVAHRGHGTWEGDLWDAAARLRRVAVDDEAGVAGARFMESYESRHSDHSFTARVASVMGVTRPPLRMDSQAKYGLLSRGDAQLFMRFPPRDYREKIWDHCAGVVIVEEAGGRVTDAGGAPLDFSRGRWLHLDRGIVAGPPRAHAALLEAVAAVGGEEGQGDGAAAETAAAAVAAPP